MALSQLKAWRHRLPHLRVKGNSSASWPSNWNISFFLPFGPRMEYFWLSCVSRLPIHPAHLGTCHEPVPYILVLNLSIYVIYITWASQVALVIKNPPAKAGDIKRHRSDPWFGKILWRRARQPTPVFLPGESHGQRSLVGYSPKGRKELNITKVTRKCTYITHVCLDFPSGSDCKASVYNEGDQGSIPGLGRSAGEGNGNPLQCSRLENPMDGGAWWATVHGVAKSRTRLSDFIFTFMFGEDPWESLGLQGAQINLKGNQPWIFTGRTEAEAPILQPPNSESWLIEKTLMLGKIEGRRREWQRMRWLDSIHLKGHEYEQSPGDSGGQGSLACCSP